MFTSRLLNRFEHKVLGDGNCAFNAFSLGLREELNQIEVILRKKGEQPDKVFSNFLHRVRPVLGLTQPSWVNLRNEMSSLYQQSPKLYQQKQKNCIKI